MHIKNALKLVCIGGGTGLSSLLSGIKQYINNRRDLSEIIDMDNLAAIVSVSDDGGSSGRLIEEFGIIPPGDIRKLLVALSNEDELLAQLFEYRFSSRGELGGHTVGNLLLIALMEINNGSFPKAIEEASRLLSTRGNIIPVSLDCNELCAELTDGDLVCGESNIPERVNRKPIKRVFLKPRENGKTPAPSNTPFACSAHTDAIEAIDNADAIVIGPGSLYTSIIPNLVVDGIADALRASQAIKIYVCNVMSQPGETDGYSVSDHVKAILNHAPGLSLDYIIVNNQPAPENIIKNYVNKELSELLARIRISADEALSMLSKNAEQSAEFVLNMTQYITQLSAETKQMADPANVQIFYSPERDSMLDDKVIQEDLIWTEVVVDKGESKTVIRHDPEKLARTLAKVINNHPKLQEQR